MIQVVVINFLLAISTTIGLTIIPMVTTQQFGLSIMALSCIEGGTEFLSSILRIVSGEYFDNTKNKKNIFILSTIFAFCSKAILLFPTILTIFTSSIIDRLANGLFASPRDAFIGQSTRRSRAMALSLLSCSKTLGCVVGPLIVSSIVIFYGDLSLQINKLVLISVGFTVLAIILSFLINTNVDSTTLKRSHSVTMKPNKLLSIMTPILVVATCFFLARFNYGMVMLYLKAVGFPEWFYLSTLGLFNVLMFLILPIFGFLIDRKKVKICLLITIISLIIFSVLFYCLREVSFSIAVLGLIAWAIQRVGAQITFSAIIFEIIPQKNYGTGIGIYSVLSDVAMLISSLICGFLADIEFSHIFLFSGIISVICFIITIRFYVKREINSNHFAITKSKS